MTKILSLAFLLLPAIPCELVAAPEMATPIIRSKTKAFVQRESQFRYREDQARELLYAAIKHQTNAAFSRSCLFIVGTEYMFGVPRKNQIPVSGFYVDGNTGRITKRDSTRYINWFNTKLPKDAYEKEEVIREGLITK